MTEEEWAEKYQPVSFDGSLLTDSISFEWLTRYPQHIWTQVDTDYGVYIRSGRKLVNRNGNYFTLNPWEEDTIVGLGDS